MGSPYQDYLAEQTEEILKLFKPADGIFFDMCWDQPSLSNYAVEGMARAGLDPENEADRMNWSHQVSLQYMKRYFDMVRVSSKMRRYSSMAGPSAHSRRSAVSNTG